MNYPLILVIKNKEVVKLNIIVLAGGYSPERNVSLASGALIANALQRFGNKVAIVDPYFDIDLDMVYEEFNNTDEYSFIIEEDEPDLEKLKLEKNNNELIGNNFVKACKKADVIFNTLHGNIGENGQIQSILDLFNIKYTGSRFEGSLIAMDKYLTKILLNASNIVTPEAKLLNNSNVEEIIKECNTYPYFVKPRYGGSSIGISQVFNQKQLTLVLENCLSENQEVLIEKKVVGREFSVGILQERALSVIEIISSGEFYDYKGKYQQGITKEICPADLSPSATFRLKELALNIHNILGLKDYSRIDFIMGDDSVFYCLEANSLPGMTPTSLLPQMALADGISFDELCLTIANLAKK